MMILNGFLLQLRAIVGFERETVVAAPMRPSVLLEPRLVVLEQGFAAEWALAVGPARRVHLEQAEVHAQLNSFAAVFNFELADGDLPRLVIPLLQEVRDVEIHALQIWTARCSKSTREEDPAKSCVLGRLRPTITYAVDCPGDGPRDPVSGKRKASAAEFVAHAPGQPQVSLRRHQAHAEMARVARSVFPGADRPELRRNL